MTHQLLTSKVSVEQGLVFEIACIELTETASTYAHNDVVGMFHRNDVQSPVWSSVSVWTRIFPCISIFQNATRSVKIFGQGIRIDADRQAHGNSDDVTFVVPQFRDFDIG